MDPPAAALTEAGTQAWPSLSFWRCWKRPASLKFFEVLRIFFTVLLVSNTCFGYSLVRCLSSKNIIITTPPKHHKTNKQTRSTKSTPWDFDWFVGFLHVFLRHLRLKQSGLVGWHIQMMTMDGDMSADWKNGFSPSLAICVKAGCPPPRERVFLENVHPQRIIFTIPPNQSTIPTQPLHHPKH